MTRGISPPPSKRRKTSNTQSVPIVPSAQPVIPLPELNDESTMRIFSWNINGIAPFLQKPITTFFQTSKTSKVRSGKEGIPPASLRGFLQRHQWPAVLFLQEVKIAASDTKTQDAVKNAVNVRLPSELASAKERGPVYEAHFTLPSDPQNARGLRGSGRVYGVCSIVRSDIFSRCEGNVRTVDWDKEGRVSIVEVQSPSMKLALFNIYAVNGTDNPYRDPSSGALRGTRHDRKLQFHRLLMEECLRLENEGWHILLAGDMNVAPSLIDGYPRLRTFPHQHVLNRADFNAKFLGGKKEGSEQVFNGVDVWRNMHGNERRYTYFPRSREWGSSCDRVDYVIAGKSLWEKEMVKGCGILDSDAERGPSDHVPIWVDINLDKHHEPETRT